MTSLVSSLFDVNWVFLSCGECTIIYIDGCPVNPCYHSNSRSGKPALFISDDSVISWAQHHTKRETTVVSLSADLESMRYQSDKWNMSFKPDKYHSLTLSIQKDRKTNSPFYFQHQQRTRTYRWEEEEDWSPKVWVQSDWNLLMKLWW